MTGVLDAELEPDGADGLRLRWRDAQGAAPAVSLRVGTDPRHLSTAPLAVTATDAGTVAVERAGPRTFVLVTPLDDPRAAVVAGERQVRLLGTRNIRDLGGYPLAGGGHTAWATLYRGEALVAMPPEGSRAVEALGLRTVVDLRGSAERGRTPSVWPRLGIERVATADIPDGLDGEGTSIMAALRAGTLRRFDVGDMAAFYVASLERLAPEYGRAVRALGRPGALPGLVHCHAGKDRTGLVTAMVLSVCGVAREDVVGDFRLTELYRPNRLEAFRAELEELGVVPDEVATVFACPPEALHAALDSVEARHGSITDYLHGPAGVPAAALERLRDALVAPVGERTATP